jgi:hypothetical protein
LIYSSSVEQFDEDVEKIKNGFPQFYLYLQKNWLDHRELFAGFSRRGVLTFDNHTNNRLERYHYTIKLVIISSQVTVGNLVDRLSKIVTVRTVSYAHKVFDRKFKTNGKILLAIQPYESVMSNFAFQRLRAEYNRSLQVKGIVVDNGDGTFNIGAYDVTPNACT